ncbi:MAG: hypothetical protein WBQ05_01550 [Candidatus Competibacter denitrificans]|jgi:hypothetical protein
MVETPTRTHRPPVTSEAQRRRIQQIAYDLWCIQEDHRLSATPLSGLKGLVAELRQRNTQLTDALLDQGIDLFLQGQIDAQCERLTQRERQLFFLRVHQSLSPRWIPEATPPRQCLIRLPTTGACTLPQRTGYNKKNARAV